LVITGKKGRGEEKKGPGSSKACIIGKVIGRMTVSIGKSD